MLKLYCNAFEKYQRKIRNNKKKIMNQHDVCAELNECEKAQLKGFDRSGLAISTL